MLKKFFISLFLITGIFLFSSDAFAWPDGQRQGFLLGFHAGYSFTSIQRDDYEDITGSGILAGPYIGYGFNEHVLLNFRVRYYQTSSDTGSLEFYTTAIGGDVMLFPMADLGLFFDIGIARAIAANNTTATPPWGTIFEAGVGFFFVNYFFASVDYSLGSFEFENSNTKMDTGTLSLSIGCLFY